jgi:ABC-type multidrug transport system ATPase subunit
MLTGLLKPTSGKATVFGFDIFSQMDCIRQISGVCPQHNILFDYLTVREHLELYAAFKGVPPEEIEHKTDSMIIELELQE